jgi:3-dehydroquinate synthase
LKLLEVKAESMLSRIIIGEKLENLVNYIGDRKCIIITDTNVSKLYRKNFPLGIPVIEIGLGEKNKTIQTLETIFDSFIWNEVDRSTLVVAIGGGIVCDVAGFAASVFMRGIPVGFVSTTLLSQVDASVGGKNGVNFSGFKNMIGVFNQPEFVICDIDMLRTLDIREYRAGFSEIIKSGAIKNPGLFYFCEENVQDALNLNPDIIEEMVCESVFVKAKVVEVDEKEKGERRLLNFGHTFAHAIEKMTGILHGEAVSIGMVIAAKISEKMEMISEYDTNRLIKVLQAYGLPVVPNIDLVELFSAMRKDKKREGDSIHLVLLESIGKAVTRKMTYDQLEQIVNDLRIDFGKKSE